MIRSYKIENQYLRIKTLNIGASLFEVFDKKKKINLILNLGSQKVIGKEISKKKNFYLKV